MSTRYAVGRKAVGLCDICGQTFKLATFKAVIRKGSNTGILACRACWDPDHPQLMLGEFPVYDPQALRNPRSDSVEITQVRSLFFQAVGVSGYGRVGTVTGV